MGRKELVELKGILLLVSGDTFPAGKITVALLQQLVRQDIKGRENSHGIPLTFDDQKGDLCVGFVDRLWLAQLTETSAYRDQLKKEKMKNATIQLRADISIRRDLLPDDDTFYPTVKVVMGSDLM